MRRRDFISTLIAGAAATAPLLGDQSVVSQNPLIAEYNLESLETLLTPVSEFYVRCHGPVPTLGTHPMLRIEGEVEKPVSLDQEALSRLRTREFGAVLECSGDGNGPYALAGNARWEGWPLAAVLEQASLLRSASFLHLYGADGFLRSVPASRVSGDALLATRMNGQPLTPEHGGPWRVFFPGWYGMDSVKWVQRIVAARSPIQPIPDDYQAILRGANGETHRAALPPVQMKSAFVYPAVGAVIRRGRLDARGLAWSDGAPIMAVEVSPDGGKTWKLAQLGSGSKYEWKMWRASIQLAETGIAQLACKALGPGGKEQPVSRDPNRVDGYADNLVEKIRVMVI